MSYATIAEADLILTTEPWISLTDPEKQYSLDMGTLWIDEAYACVATDPVQDNLIQANILLADKHANGNLYQQREGELSGKSSKADTVNTSKTYRNGSASIDPFAEVKLLIGSVCPLASAALFKTVRV